MTEKIFFPQPLIPLQPKTEQHKTKVQEGQKGSFEQMLQQQIGEVKFSNHARQRLVSRNINLSVQELDKLNTAIDKAAQKGARESLILMDNLALVVSVKNKTVITAVDGGSLKENVFTNIDSAVIL